MTDRYVLLNRSYASRRALIEEIGAVMVRAGAVTPAYVEGMLRKEEQGGTGTVVMPEVALPHGTHDVKSAVLRNVLVLVQIPAGVEWSGDRTVRLAIGFAGTGDEAHVRLVSGIARLLTDPCLLERLKTSADADEVGCLLDSSAETTAENRS